MTINIDQILNNWKKSLLPNVAVGSLYRRNPIAHKWKVTFRCLVLREAVFWRIHDLLSQAHFLHKAGHTLGSRILLRSGFETLAILIYLNQLIQSVVAGTEGFHEFSQKTSKLLLGSRNKSTKHESINIMSVLKKCDKKFPRLLGLYESLSESAHPNFEGTCVGYSRVDHDNYETSFSNNWAKMYADQHHSIMCICMTTFESEYNDEWRSWFKRLEAWIEANDAALEATNK